MTFNDPCARMRAEEVRPAHLFLLLRTSAAPPYLGSPIFRVVSGTSLMVLTMVALVVVLGHSHPCALVCRLISLLGTHRCTLFEGWGLFWC